MVDHFLCRLSVVRDNRPRRVSGFSRHERRRRLRWAFDIAAQIALYWRVDMFRQRLRADRDALVLMCLSSHLPKMILVPSA
jgi:hypothetical protein